MQITWLLLRYLLIHLIDLSKHLNKPMITVDLTKSQRYDLKFLIYSLEIHFFSVSTLEFKIFVSLANSELIEISISSTWEYEILVESKYSSLIEMEILFLKKACYFEDTLLDLYSIRIEFLAFFFFLFFKRFI